MTEYEKLIWHRLIDKDMTQAELIRRVRERTGGYLDRSYLNKLVKGQARSERMISAINEILEIR